ncbi:PRC and DUF2382 domain-containing protein [Streptomyces sp. NBC_00523]|uniref:PRC and DUF2382 domain-containing protein n=1 Tax=Streptomyces sp. NBC_00523 TaxID=2975765 RepID=UPI002E81A970|nr:PRC and DUF2382 domain-containing protein [Streptomyces sp. NBC_00523]WUC98677.1 PRC and DUF2382 domain-containing protein [Streptomyces sp. NBC_00523]
MGAADGFTDSGELDGLTVYDTEGEKIGNVGRVYVDDSTGRPDWITVKTGLFGMKESFVPLAGARRVGSDLHISHGKDQVKEAPRVDADAHLSVSEEEELYRHYGLTRNTRGNLGDSSGTGAPTTTGTGTMGAAGTGAAAGAGAGAGAMGAAGTSGKDRTQTAGTGRHRDTEATGTGAGRPLAGAGAGAQRSGADLGGKEEMIRSEEQLHIGTEEYESGRARLHKYVVTENVTRSVPVSHEEVRVVREPLQPGDKTTRAGDLTEQDVEVTLHAERATMRKETVPVERVRMETQRVTEQKEVSAELRKEQIDYADGTTKDGKDMGGKDTGGDMGRGRHR